MSVYPYDVSWQRQLVSHGGSVFFVNSTSGTKSDSNQYGGSPDQPFATLAYALTKCTASKGDTIYVMPGHAETITTAIAMSVIGVSVIGLGRGRNIPAFTGSGAIDVMDVSAASCWLENCRFIGAAASVTALINIRAADLRVEKCLFTQAETPVTAITVASGGHRFHFKDCKFLSTADGPDHAFDFESSASDDWFIEGCYFNFTSFGLDNAVFRANVDATKGGIIKDCVAIGLDATCLMIDFNSSHAVGEGLMVNSYFQANGAATIANLLDLGGYGTSHESGGSDGPNRTAALPATTAS